MKKRSKFRGCDNDTQFKEIDTSFVSTNIEIVFQKSTCLESQLCEIMAAIIPEQYESTWFQHLNVRGVEH